MILSKINGSNGPWALDQARQIIMRAFSSSSSSSGGHRLLNTITTIDELKRPHVHVKSLERLERLVTNMIRMGKDQLQVITDFDMTLTPSHSPTSNALLETSRFVTPRLKKQFQELRNRFVPIEHDPRLTREQKTPYMIEWWTRSLDLTVQTRIERAQIRELVHEAAGTSLKSGCKLFLEYLECHGVPVLVFSAGLGDVINEWLRKENQCSFSNLRIVSNFMRFDEMPERIVGFRNRVIHVFNKNETVLTDTDDEKCLRPNVILLGDSLGDVAMTVGLGRVENVLKIGFLNDHVDRFLPAYVDAYDVVLVADNSFDIPNAILKVILKK